MNEMSVSAALRNRHADESWAYFEELRTRTGNNWKHGFIDAYAVGLWEQNRAFIAYEIKHSRGDFKSDVEQFTSKQGDALRNSTQFYYVCPHGLIRPDEVPEVCGLMWIDAGGAKAKKVAPVRELKIGGIESGFACALMRASAGKPPKKTCLWKYCGKELDEEEILSVAKDIGAIRSQKDIEYLANELAAKKRQRSWAILKKLAKATGMFGDLMDGTIESIVDSFVKNLEESREASAKARDIAYNAKRIRQLSNDLVLLTEKETEEETTA